MQILAMTVLCQSIAGRSDQLAADELKRFSRSSSVLNFELRDNPISEQVTVISSSFDLLVPSPAHVVMKIADFTKETRERKIVDCHSATEVSDNVISKVWKCNRAEVDYKEISIL